MEKIVLSDNTNNSMREKILSIYNTLDKLSCYKNNWDGHGSLAPDTESVRLAKKVFLQMIFSCDEEYLTILANTLVEIDEEGVISLEYPYHKGGKPLYIKFRPDGVHFERNRNYQSITEKLPKKF